MEPKLPVPTSSQEMGGYNPQVLTSHPEVSAGLNAEPAPERTALQEQQPVSAVQSSPGLPVVPQQSSIPPTASMPAPSPVPVADSNPTIAGDDEVIEKEWVDKAKKIVADTKDDPYRQEKEVSKLQADYLKKRYGKEVKIASD